MQTRAAGAVIALFLAAFAPIAFGQATRTWVSGVGDDVNPASRTAPAKTFAGAISKTAAGGEISVLDPGGYGAVTITKSITIDGASFVGSILASGTTGIQVQAGAEGVVVLRRLSINGAGTGIAGIRILSAKLVVIEDCVVSNFNQAAIELAASAACTLIINRVTINNAADGISINHPDAVVTVADSRVQAVRSTAIAVQAGHAMVLRSIVSDSKVGIAAGEGAGVRLAENTITGNGVALQGPGPITSFGNNTIVGNISPGVAPSAAKQQ